MANWFYFDSSDTRQGPYNDAQLKALAENGSITPDTRVEDESGRRAKARNIKGLFPQPVPPPVRAKQHSDTVSPDNPYITPQPKKTDTSATEKPSINPPSAAATSCPHCGVPMTAGEKFCGSCGKSPSEPVKPVSQSSGAKGAPFAQSYDPPQYKPKRHNPQQSSGGEGLDIGFTRFITPIYISVIWIICIVVNAISLLVSPIWIGMMAYKVSQDGFGRADNPAFGVFVFILGFLASIILHSQSLLFARIVLEGIIVLFKIEKNTRRTAENTRAICRATVTSLFNTKL